MVTGLIMVGLWGVSNPASIVARTNLHRAEHGHRFDLDQVELLGPDAVPALLAGLASAGPAEANQLRSRICALAPAAAAGPWFNLSLASARDDLARACGP